MAIFNCYVSSPEGKPPNLHPFFCCLASSQTKKENHGEPTKWKSRSWSERETMVVIFHMFYMFPPGFHDHVCHHVWWWSQLNPNFHWSNPNSLTPFTSEIHFLTKVHWSNSNFRQLNPYFITTFTGEIPLVCHIWWLNPNFHQLNPFFDQSSLVKPQLSPIKSIFYNNFHCCLPNIWCLNPNFHHVSLEKSHLSTVQLCRKIFFEAKLSMDPVRRANLAACAWGQVLMRRYHGIYHGIDRW